MTTFHVEKWATFHRDAHPLFDMHWKELALDQAKIPLGLDSARFQVLCDQGLLHIVTARKAGVVIGYFVAIVMPHLHYKDAGLMAFTDMYFIRPGCRKGGCGVKLFTEAERTLRERGVVKAYLSTKVHQDHTQLFEKLGWRLSDKSFCKVLA